jgi:hypothetical protein
VSKKRNTEKAKASERKRRARQRGERPFVGIDGEGSGTDELGRQNYMLLRCGDQELFHGGPLSTVECLDFICDLPPPEKAIIVGFAFGYDITMILRDLPDERRAWLLKEKGPGDSRYCYWGDYAIEYLNRNYLRVARMRRVKQRDGTYTRRVIEGSARTIYETFGFFQKSFMASCQSFGVGVQHWEQVQREKDARGSAEWDATTDAVRDYCRIECELLAALMERFREVCYAADIRPRSWNGAGKLSKALHQREGTPRAGQIAELVPPDVQKLAISAYYGGRFEITRVGYVPGPIHEYDIRSAYPAAMQSLPCLVHGEWEKVSKAVLNRMLAAPGRHGTFVAPVAFKHEPSGPLCGLPIRKKDGRLFWPLEGRGTYWSIELTAAAKLGCKARATGEGWRYVKRCDCQPFAWVERLYEYRKQIGSSAAGYPIKLGINGLYGAMAQRIGNPQYACMVWAGLITAWTRATLIDACAADPDAVVMMATDAVFARRPLSVTVGDKLGQWEHEERPDIFIVQPGLYWSKKKLKTRGVSAKFFGGKTHLFEDAWKAYEEKDRAALFDQGGCLPPTVQLELNLFIGLRIAQARGKPETAGKWISGKDALRSFSFAWHGKRSGYEWADGHVVTKPPLGGPSLQSVAHASDKALLAAFDIDRAELEDQPDMIDIGPPEEQGIGI